MPLLDILLGLLIFSAIILIIFLIVWLNKVGKVIDSLNHNIGDLHDKSIPLIENLTKTSENASIISTEAAKHMNDFSGIIGKLTEKLSWLKNKQNDFTQKKDYPGEGLFLNLRAISKGIGAFLKNL